MKDREVGYWPITFVLKEEGGKNERSSVDFPSELKKKKSFTVISDTKFTTFVIKAAPRRQPSILQATFRQAKHFIKLFF